jgi:glycerol-3-phosphate dehydrogenase (NAD+)
VAVIGSGNWGTVAARIVGQNVLGSKQFEDDVNMWVYEETLPDGSKLTDVTLLATCFWCSQSFSAVFAHKFVFKVINKTNENVKYLPGVPLTPNIKAVPDLKQAIEGQNISPANILQHHEPTPPSNKPPNPPAL